MIAGPSGDILAAVCASVSFYDQIENSIRKIMKLKLSMTILFTMLANTAFSSTVAMPNACPSMSEILTTRFDSVEKNSNQWMVTSNHHRYATDSEWTFGLPVVANDETEATTKAEQYIKSMSFAYGPLEVSDGWTCFYQSPEGQVAIAHTPSL